MQRKTPSPAATTSRPVRFFPVPEILTVQETALAAESSPVSVYEWTDSGVVIGGSAATQEDWQVHPRAALRTGRMAGQPPASSQRQEAAIHPQGDSMSAVKNSYSENISLDQQWQGEKPPRGGTRNKQ